VAYQRVRPDQRTDRGGLTVYRCVSRLSQPLLQTPVGWTRAQASFDPLSDDPDPQHAALLHRVGTPNVRKVWVELAYETTRANVAPHFPSRLDSLYAFADPVEAFDFQQHSDTALDVWKATIQDGVHWAVVDMAKFSIPDPPSTDAEGFDAIWDWATDNATQYWAPGETI
jgi:hypothetical protein